MPTITARLVSNVYVDSENYVPSRRDSEMAGRAWEDCPAQGERSCDAAQRSLMSGILGRKRKNGKPLLSGKPLRRKVVVNQSKCPLFLVAFQSDKLNSVRLSTFRRRRKRARSHEDDEDESAGEESNEEQAEENADSEMDVDEKAPTSEDVEETPRPRGTRTSARNKVRSFVLPVLLDLIVSAQTKSKAKKRPSPPQTDQENDDE